MKNEKYKVIQNIDILKKYNFIKPNFKESYTLSRGYKPFSHLTEKQFLNRCEKGKKTTLKKIKIENIKNAYTHLNQVVPWKLTKLQHLVSNSPNNVIYMPIVVKIEKNEYYVVDGNTVIGLFAHFKKDADIWLLDESLLTTDFKKDIKQKAIEYTPNYDYGNITEEDKALVKEIILLLEKENQFSTSELLKMTFGLRDIERYDIQSSPLYQICKEINLHFSKQGSVKVFENNKTIEYPVIAISGDIRQLNRIIEHTLSKYGKLPK